MTNRSIMVYLGANITDYQREMSKAVTPLDELVKKSGDASGQASTLMGKLAQSAKHQSAEWKTAGTSLMVVGGAMTGLSAAVAKTGIGYNTLQQTTRAALTTLLGGTQAANAQMDKLDDFARNSPFAKQVFIQAQQQMLGFGVAAENVIPALDAIQNAVAAFGGSNEQIAAIAEIMSRIKSEGRLSGDALQRLGYYGIDAAALIGSQMNKTAMEIRDMASKPGGIPVDQIWDPLVNGMQEKFGGAAEGVKDTFEGAIDRVKAAWRDLSADIMSSAVSPDGGGWLVDLTNQLADLMRAAGQLPTPVKEAGAAIFGVVGVSALAAGSLMTMIPRVYETHRAWKSLSGTFPGATRGIQGVGKAVGIAALAVIALNSAVSLLTRETRPMGDIGDALERAAKEGGNLQALNFSIAQREFAGIAISAQNLGEAFETIQFYTPDEGFFSGFLGRANNSFSSLLEVVLPSFKSALTENRDLLADVGRELASMPTDQAAAAFRLISAELTAAGASAEDLVTYLPDYANQARVALSDLADELGGPVYSTAEALVEVMSGDLPAGLVHTTDGIMTVREAAESGAQVLGDGIDIVRRYAEAHAESGDQMAESWTALGRAAASGSEEAVQAYFDYVAELGSGSAGFISVMGALNSTIDKEKEAAQASADRANKGIAANSKHKKSWEDFYDGVSFTLDSYLGELEAQVAAQAEWEQNMLLLTGRASQGLIDHLAKLGPEGAPLVAALVNASEEEMARMEDAFSKGGAESTSAFAESLINAETVWAALATKAGSSAVEAARREVAAGRKTLSDVVNNYNLEFLIDADTNPALNKAWEAYRRIQNMRPTMSVDIYQNITRRVMGQAPVATGGYMADVAAAYGFADGGWPRLAAGLIRGPGTPTSDSIPARVSRDEFIMSAAATDHYGVDNMYRLLTRQIPREWLEAARYADGGSPRYAYAPSIAPQAVAAGPTVARMHPDDIRLLASELREGVRGGSAEGSLAGTRAGSAEGTRAGMSDQARAMRMIR